MKKMVFIACALMVVAAGSAMAGTNLAWNDCLGGGGAADRTVNCTNTGSGSMYISFVLADALPAVAATDVLTDVEASTSASTTWWNPATFTTRWGAGSGLSTSGFCPGWFDGAPNGPIAFQPVFRAQLSPSRIRLLTTIVIAAGEEQSLANDGTEYLSGQLILKNSAGTLNNAECLAGGAIGVVDLNLLQPGGVPDTHLQSPEVSSCVTFRGGGGKTCPGATPTTRATWGSIKALYR